MRKSIFDLYATNNSIQHDFERINRLFSIRYYAEIDGTYYTLKEMAENWFPYWKNRGRCLDFSDYLDTIEYENIVAEAPNDIDAFITFIEFVYNMWHLCEKNNFFFEYGTVSSRDIIRNMMDEVLSEMNQKAYYDSETERCLIGEDSPQVTAAVEATEPEIASLILQYNYRRLVGDIATKKIILVQLGHDIMGKESALRANNQINLFESITRALNNLDLRHNNTDPGSNDYKEQVAHLTGEELEKWYDETYQLILYANLVLENIDRKKRMDEFIKQLNQRKEKTEKKSELAQ